MKKLRSFLLFILLVLAIAICAYPKGNVKYYRHLRLYKIHDLAFSYPVSPDSFKEINCYAVEYDENERVVSAVYLREGKPAYDNLNELSSILIQYSKHNEKWYYKALDGESIYRNVGYFFFDFDDTGKLLSSIVGRVLLWLTLGETRHSSRRNI